MSTEDERAFEEAVERTRARRERLAAQGLPEPPPKLVMGEKEPEYFDEPDELCPDCRGRTWTSVRDPETGHVISVERCSCQAKSYDSPEAVPAADLELYGCPKKLSRCLKESWDPRRGAWPQEADLWPGELYDSDGDRPSWMLIHGGVGNGKSRIAAWVMRRALAGGRSCFWIDVPLAIREVTLAIGDEEAMRSVRTRMNARLARDVVILDDVGAHRDTDWQVVDNLASWIRERDRHPGWTLATTNLSLRQLRDLHQPSASRLVSGPVLEMTGGDSRRRSWSPKNTP